MPLKIFGNKSKKPIVIGIAAGKGGVGKSSLTVLLGLALKEKGFRVGILDADLYGPSIRKMLPEERMPSQKEKTLIPAVAQGISYISMGFFRNEGQASVVRAPIANGLITQFLKQVEWGELDILLIDFPPGTGDIQITLAQQAELTGGLLVTTPQEVALIDVRKCVHLFKQVNIPLIGITENMSYYKSSSESERVYIFGSGGGEKLANENKAPLLAKIPIEPAISENLDRGASFSKLPFAIQEILIKLAEDVMLQAHAIQDEHKKGITSFELIWKYPPTETKPNKSAIISTNRRVFIQSIWQMNSHMFGVIWNDGAESEYTLAELQRLCPCAGCVNEETGERKTLGSPILDSLGAKQIHSVGRYAIRIEYNSGCSRGIYDFALLRTIKGLNP